MRLGDVLRDILTYGFGSLLGRALGFVTLPIYTRIFAPDEYGVLAYLTTLLGLLGAFAVLGGDSAYSRFFFEAAEPEERRALTSTWIPFLAAWSLVLVGVMLPFRHVLAEALLEPRFSPALTVALLSLPVIILGRMLSQVLRNEFRARAFTVLEVSTAVVGVALGLAAVLVLDWGIEGIFAGSLVGSALMLIPRGWLTRRNFGGRFEPSRLRPLLAFGVPLVPTSLAFWAFNSSDRLIIAELADLDEVGLYSVAAAVASVLALATAAIGQAWSPHAVRMYEANPDEAATKFGQVLSYVVLGMGTVAFLMSAFAKEAVDAIAGPGFEDAAGAVAPLALGAVALAATQVTAIGMTVKKRTGHLAWIAWVVASVNVALTVGLVPLFGMLGAAWATFVSYLLLAVIQGATARRFWEVGYEWRRTLPAALLVFGFSVLGSLLPGGPTGWVGKLALVLVYLGLLRVTGVVDEREISGLRSTVRRFGSDSDEH